MGEVDLEAVVEMSVELKKARQEVLDFSMRAQRARDRVEELERQLRDMLDNNGPRTKEVPAVERIMKHFQENPGLEFSVEEIFAFLTHGGEIPLGTIRATLARLVQEGQLERVSRGRYVLNTPENRLFADDSRRPNTLRIMGSLERQAAAPLDSSTPFVKFLSATLAGELSDVGLGKEGKR